MIFHRRRVGATGGAQAKALAVDDLHEAASRRDDVRDLHARLERELTTNHFADMARTSMGRTRHA